MDVTSMGYKLGVVVGVLAGLVIAALLIRWSRVKGRKRRCEFDERQELIRGRGFKYGFYTLLIYMFAYGFMESILERPFIDPMVGSSVGCMIGITVWAGYGIWHDAYLALNENVKKIYIIFIAALVFNLASGIMHIIEGDIIENDVLSIGGLNLLCGFMILVILIIMGAKNLRDRRMEDED